MKRMVGIFIFNDVELLDFCGPFEVFSVAGSLLESHPLEVLTVAQTLDHIYTRGNLLVQPAHSFENCPDLDILLIPGGMGTRPLLNEPLVLDWIRMMAGKVELLLSVCTGSLLLAKAGLLDKVAATSHHGALDLLGQIAPEVRVVRAKRFVDTGKIITSAGISAGIDMSLHVIFRLFGPEAVKIVTTEMEYRADLVELKD